MSKVTIVPFEEHHLEPDGFGERELQLVSTFGAVGISAMAAVSRCYTIFNGLEIITFGGVYELWPGTVECWQMPSMRILETPVLFAKSTKQFLDHLLKTHDGLKRAQTVCIDDKMHANWMGFLGFEPEGVMKKYRDDQDYRIYSRVGQWA